MKKILVLFLALFTFTGAIYYGAGYYFSSVVIDFKHRTLEEDRANLGITGYREFGLNDPLDFELDSGGESPVNLRGWVFSARHDNPDCVVIFHHGITGTRYGALKYVEPFRERNCDLVFFDARKHGQSTGRYGTYGYYEADDLLAVVDFMKSETGLSENRIGLVGESLGGAIALLAATDRKFAFVLADSPYSDLYSIVSDRAADEYGSLVVKLVPVALRLAGYRANFKPADVNIARYVETLETPVMIVHSLADDYTPVEHSRRIFSNINHNNKRLFLTDWDASHARSIDTNPDEYNREVRRFLVQMEF